MEVFRDYAPAINDETRSHSVIIWPAATLGRDPSDDLVGIGNIAGLAMHAVRWIEADALAIRLLGVVHHLIDICGTKLLARTAILFYAFRVADVGVVNHQMRRLVLLVLGTGVIEIGELIKGEFTVALSGAD